MFLFYDIFRSRSTISFDHLIICISSYTNQLYQESDDIHAFFNQLYLAFLLSSKTILKCLIHQEAYSYKISHFNVSKTLVNGFFRLKLHGVSQYCDSLAATVFQLNGVNLALQHSIPKHCITVAFLMFTLEWSTMCKAIWWQVKIS